MPKAPAPFVLTEASVQISVAKPPGWLRRSYRIFQLCSRFSLFLRLVAAFVFAFSDRGVMGASQFIVMLDEMSCVSSGAIPEEEVG